MSNACSLKLRGRSQGKGLLIQIQKKQEEEIERNPVRVARQEEELHRYKPVERDLEESFLDERHPDCRFQRGPGRKRKVERGAVG